MGKSRQTDLAESRWMVWADRSFVEFRPGAPGKPAVMSVKHEKSGSYLYDQAGWQHGKQSRP